MPTTEFASYGIVVVDYACPADAVAELRRQGKVVFDYLSLAKVHRKRHFASDVQSIGIEDKPDPQFPGSVRVNDADPKWSELLVQVIVPQIKKLGFKEIFLDDLDALKKRKIEKYGVALIHDIRRANPEL